MQLFNREPATASFYNKYNCLIGSGNTQIQMGENTIDVPDCIFAGALFRTGWYNSENLMYAYFVCSRQLTTAERTVAIKTWNTTNGYTVNSTTVMNEYSANTTFVSGGSGDNIRMWDYFTAEDLQKANATKSQRPFWIYYFSYPMQGGSNEQPVQTDWICNCDGVPMVVPDGSAPDAATNANWLLCEGRFWRCVIDGVWNPRLTVSGVYENPDAWTKYQNGGKQENYSYVNWWYLWVLANGNLSTDFDIDTPFNPLPTDFYITVNANSDHEQKGEQSVNFTWTSDNAEDTDLSNVTLHFQFTHDDKDYQADVSYTEEGYACTYRDLLEKMEVPWWKNVIQKIPLIGSQLSNSTIAVNIWWSDVTGEAGKCVYRMEYDGRENAISTAQAQDSETGYWTYLTAEDEDINQSPDTPNNPYDDDYTFTGGTDSVNGSALLTTSYGLSVSGAHDFGSWLWGTGFDLDQLKMVVNNPIENVVACKLFPFSVSGTTSTVKIGNLTSPVSALYLPENVARTFDFGSITVNKANFPNLHGNFLDYAPFTSVHIYLPYLGFHELDTDLCMGASVGVKYYVDFVTGACRAIVTSTVSGNTKVLQSFDGNIGQDVPITASNRAQVEAGYVVGGAQAVASFASGIGAIATGNVGGGLSGIGNAITGGLQTAMQMYHSYTAGTPSPALSRFDEQRPYLIMDTPVYTEPKKYAHQNGHMCNLDCQLSTLHGYTVVENTVDLSSIPCNFEEREALLELLTSGIYL